MTDPDYDPADDSRRSYDLGRAAQREQAVRARKYLPLPDKPHEAAWAAQGPVPVPMLDASREGER